MYRRRSVSAVHSRRGYYDHVLSSGDAVCTGDMTTVHGEVSEFVLFTRC
jgi:hypothetical protein